MLLKDLSLYYPPQKRQKVKVIIPKKVSKKGFYITHYVDQTGQEL